MDHFMGRVAVLHAKLRGWVLAGTGGATVMIANPYALHRPRATRRQSGLGSSATFA
jgi:hypothetical protein